MATTLIVLNSIVLVTSSIVIMFSTNFYTQEMKNNAKR